jgi:hypothetical protein
MMCFLCGKEIAWLRSMVDRQYCCAEHRKEARLASANAIREEEDEAELWSVSKNRERQASRYGNANQTASIFAFLSLGALLVALLLLPGGKSGGGSASPSVSEQPGAKEGLFERAGASIGALVRQSAPVTLHHDFSSGLSDWTTAALQGSSRVEAPRDWKIPGAPSVVPPGSLRLWSRSTTLHNYQMEFQGQLEKRSLSWAFRASNSANYYAAKLVMTKTDAGPSPNAGLVHYVMLNGHEADRVQLPLPLRLARGEKYRVRVSVQDDHFITYINGQAISSWTDQRLSHGGVGFFADNDDEQRVSWVNLSEHDSFLGRMLARFSLFIVPQLTPGLNQPLE